MFQIRFWIAVASRNHVMKGVEGGFAQVCHGKCSPLKRMRQGDGLIYYSPRFDFEGKEPCKAFTAIGRIVDGQAYEFDMGAGFVPFRMNVQYLNCIDASIESLIDQLSFIKDKKRWGFPFRFGHFEIAQDDFDLIAMAMGVRESEPFHGLRTQKRNSKGHELKGTQHLFGKELKGTQHLFGWVVAI